MEPSLPLLIVGCTGLTQSEGSRLQALNVNSSLDLMEISSMLSRIMEYAPRLDRFSYFEEDARDAIAIESKLTVFGYLST